MIFVLDNHAADLARRGRLDGNADWRVQAGVRRVLELHAETHWLQAEIDRLKAVACKAGQEP